MARAYIFFIKLPKIQEINLQFSINMNSIEIVINSKRGIYGKFRSIESH